MKKLKGILVLVFLLALLASPISVLASDVTGAKYYGLIQVSNNGTAVTNVATTCNISTENLVSGGYLNSSANNCAIQSSAGADLPFQPSVNATYPWGLWVPSMGANSIKTDILYTANTTGGKIRYFPGASGMTTLDDDPDLELGDNFTITQSGWWDTDAGANKNAVLKEGAFRTFVSGSESITSAIARDALHFDGSSDSSVNCTAINNAAAKYWWSMWFKFDNTYTSANGTEYLMSKYIDAEDYIQLRFHNATGKLLFVKRDGNVETFLLPAQDSNGDNITSWTGGQWYHIIASISSAEGARLIVDGGTAVTDADTSAVCNGGNQVIGHREVNSGVAEGFVGIIANVCIGTDDLTPTEEAALYTGTAPVDATDYWYIDEGEGIYIASYGTVGTTGSADSNCSWTLSTMQTPPDISVTATGVTSDEHVVSVTGSPLVFADGNALHFIRSATSGINCGAISDNVSKLWVSFWFRLASDWVLGEPTNHMYLWGKFLNGDNYIRLNLDKDNGLLYFSGKALNLGFFSLSSTTNSWDGDRWYHIIASVTDTAGGKQRLLVDGDLEDSDTIGAVNTPITTNFLIGNYLFPATNRGLVGELANFVTGTDDLIPAEETALFYGVAPGDETDLWYIDEGTGTAITSYGSAANPGTAGIANSWEESVRPSKFVIRIDTVDKDSFARPPIDVPDTGNDWSFLLNNVMPYMEYQKIWIDGVLQQHIVWEYDTTFTDLSGKGHDATPSFRIASSDADVSAELVSFLPISEAKAPAYVLEEAIPFIEEVPEIVSDFDVSPDPAVGEFPLAGVIATVAAATTLPTPSQLPLVLIAGFTIIGLSLAISGIMRKYGSGTIFVKILVIAGIMGIFVAFGNFGIDFWMIFIFLIIGVALAMASRHVSWQ